MDVLEIRNELRKIFEAKLKKVYADSLGVAIDKYELNIKIGDVLLEYLDVGGVIEEGSVFEFTEQMLLQRNCNLKNLNVRDYLNLIDDMVPKTISYEEAKQRNKELSTGDAVKIINRDETYKDILEKLKQKDKTALELKNGELTSLEAEAKTISEAEALVDKQLGKDGQDIGE